MSLYHTQATKAQSRKRKNPANAPTTPAKARKKFRAQHILSAERSRTDTYDGSIKNFYETSLFMGEEAIDSRMFDCDLLNDVDPIWHPDNFRNVEYEYIQPATRLATRLRNELVRKDGSPIDKIVNCRVRTVEVGVMNANDHPHEAYEEPEETLEERQHAVRAALDRLSEVVAFQPCPKLKAGGSTQALNPKEAPAGFQQRHANEWPSVVKFSESLYRLIVELTDSGEDPLRLMMALWQLAVLLVHESTHALTYGQVFLGDDVHNEIFMNACALKSPLSEIGFEAEAALFGGQFKNLFAQDDVHVQRYRYADGKLSGFQGIPVFWEWPNRVIWQHYKGANLPMGRRVGPVLPVINPAWRVRTPWFVQQFQTSFWETQVAIHGVEALQFPRELAYRFTSRDDVVYPFCQEDISSIPDGFWSWPSGDIVPAAVNSVLISNVKIPRAKTMYSKGHGSAYAQPDLLSHKRAEVLKRANAARALALLSQSVLRLRPQETMTASSPQISLSTQSAISASEDDYTEVDSASTEAASVETFSDDSSEKSQPTGMVGMQGLSADLEGWMRDGKGWWQLT